MLTAVQFICSDGVVQDVARPLYGLLAQQHEAVWEWGGLVGGS